MKKLRIRSAIPIYGCAALWLLAGICFLGLMLKIWFLLLLAALSVATYLLLTKRFPGREVERRERARSGDSELDALIEAGRARLDSLKAADAAISDEAISRNLARMVSAGEGIFERLERDAGKRQEVRRFMNYYLPTAEKLMNTYRLLMETRGGENIAQAMRSVENSLGMIASAFEKQLDNIYSDQALDIETDIQVLETMMASDGLTRRDGLQG